MGISIKSKNQVYKATVIVGIGAVVISNMLTCLFEIFLSPPLMLQDLVIPTLMPGIVAPVVAALIFGQALSLYNLNVELRREIESRKAIESELVQANHRLSEANEAALTAQRTAEESRRVAEEARRTAESANRAKSVFLANISHELRTPLNAVLGFSELMTRDPNITREQRENLDIIGRSGEHLLALINDVLDLSKIESGKDKLEPEVFDLYEMLLGLGEMFSLRAEVRDLTVVFDLASDVPCYIHADVGKLRQVLINLLGNAVKFTERGGVTVRVGMRIVSTPENKSVSLCSEGERENV